MLDDPGKLIFRKLSLHHDPCRVARDKLPLLLGIPRVVVVGGGDFIERPFHPILLVIGGERLRRQVDEHERFHVSRAVLPNVFPHRQAAK